MSNLSDYVLASVAPESSARSASDSTLQSNISQEATARASADSTLTSLLNAEITARIAADSTLAANSGGVTTQQLNSTALIYSLIF